MRSTSFIAFAPSTSFIAFAPFLLHLLLTHSSITAAQTRTVPFCAEHQSV